VIGGVLVFVGLGRLDGTVITQSIFPSLIALAGTALGFYFGSQSAKNADSSSSNGSQRLAFKPATVPGDSGSAKNAGSGSKLSNSIDSKNKDAKPDDTQGG